jgi:glycosyltransferase involved in cell wall biosynthesis
MAERHAAAASPLRVLHLASGNRWTGAAAPAFAEVAALRQAGVDAHYAYVGGYKLEEKIGHHEFAHALIPRAQNPWNLARAAAAVGRLVDRLQIDLLHAHLSWDHWIARIVAQNRDLVLARTYHSRRAMRHDPLSRFLAAGTDLFFVVNGHLASRPLLRKRPVAFTPPPLDLHQFTAHGPNARSLHAIGGSEPVVAVIGKLSAGRGFEDAMRTFQALRKDVPAARLLIIGHGEHRPSLEALSRSLGIERAVIWAGYHEDDLAEHYRAADLLLFTARGSDEGHRAILEALGCGLPVASMPIDGVEALLPARMIADQHDPDMLASVARALLHEDRGMLREEAVAHARGFGLQAAAERLIAAYRR